MKPTNMHNTNHESVEQLIHVIKEKDMLIQKQAKQIVMLTVMLSESLQKNYPLNYLDDWK